MPKFFLCILLSIQWDYPCFSQQKTPAEFVNPDGFFDSEDWGIKIKEIGNSKALVDENSSQKMVPASLVKAITAAEGFRVLGKEFSFKTIVASRGTIDPVNGSLKGDLLIIGSGDPTFASTRFDRQDDFKMVMELLKEKGIKNIQGKVVIHSGLFAPPYVSGDWKYADMGNYYAAGAYGFNYLDNRFKVVFQKSPIPGGSCTIIKIKPQPIGVEIISTVRAGEEGSGDQAYIHGAPFAKKLFITGAIPPGEGEFSIKGALPDPAAQAALDLAKLLLYEKIEISGNVISDYDHQTYLNLNNLQLDTLGIVSSSGLNELSNFMLKKSDNLIAECIGRASDMENTTSPMTSNYGFFLKDRSGLSRSNRISATGMVNFLEDQVSKSYFPDFLNCFPVSSESGTLKNRFKDGKLKQKVYAKTGSMNGIRALAGFIVYEGQPTHAFCYMVNTDDNAHGLELQKRLDQYLESLDLVH